jgi:hypothetical protein
MKLRVLLLQISFLVILPGSVSLFSQTNDYLDILRVDVDSFPKVNVFVRAFCNGVQQPFIDPTTLRIYDRDTSKTASISCPTNGVPISVGLTLDRSNSVAGTSIILIREGAKEFVRLMGPRLPFGTDEALVVSFNENIYYDHMMSTDKQSLTDAIHNIIEFGNTAIWDAVMFSLQEVANTATNQVKAVILLSDGTENASTSTPRDVIDYSRQLGIPVYTIGMLYHAIPDDLAQLKMISDSTGGKYIPVENPFQIILAFKAINSIIPDGQNDCTIDFISSCADGTVRLLVVEADVCGRTLVDSVYYRVPLDPSLPKLHIDIDTAIVYSGGDVYVPVMISSIGGPANITKLNLEIDRPPGLTFKDIITQGHVASAFTVTSSLDPSALIIELNGSHQHQWTDTLLVLHYKAKNLTAGDTLVQLPFLYVEKNTDECFQLEVSPGWVKILRRTALWIDCEDDTLRIPWDRDLGRFRDSVFVVSALVENPSLLPVSNPLARIILAPGLELAQGSSEYYLPSTTLASGANALVQFVVRVVPNDSARVLSICIEVEADSTAISRCCTRVEIEKAYPLLESWCSLPKNIRWIDSLDRYEPESFPVTISVRNLSELRAQNIEAWIHIPPRFEIDTSITPVNTMIAPSTLFKSDTGTVTWYITPSERPTSDTLEFCIKSAAGLDTTVCCYSVYIEAAPIRATLRCADPMLISYEDATKEYNPSNLLYSVKITNNSELAMSQARGRIYLPPFIKVSSGDYIQKDVPGGGVIQPGETKNLLWILETDGEPVENSEICAEILASNYPGETCCTPVTVKRNLQLPRLVCTLDGPDTIRFVQNAYQPNPFVLDINVRNIGDGPAMKVYAALLQGSDLSIDSTDQALKLIADSLAENQDVNSSFTIKVLNRLVTRSDTIRVSVYAENGGSAVCEKIIIIEAVRGPIIRLTCEGPDSLIFDDATNAYIPTPFTVRIVAQNVGTAAADSVIAEFLASPNIELVAGETAAKMLNPEQLLVGESGNASWQVNAVPRSIGRLDTIWLQVRVKNALLEEIIPCPVPIYIPPVRNAELHALCEALDEFTVVDGEYQPDRVTIQTTVSNDGTADAFDILVKVVSMSGPLVLSSGTADEQTVMQIANNGGSSVLSWFVDPLSTTTGDTAEICFQISGRFQNNQLCCVKIYVPPIISIPGDITVGCSAIDTVRGDDSTRLYPNPVVVSATVTNLTVTQVDTVRATIILPNGVSLSVGETQERILTGLIPQDMRLLSWNLDFLSDTSTVAKARHIRIQFIANGKVEYCDLTLIVLPFKPIGGPSMELSCASPDSILYINSKSGLQPSPFSVRITVSNTGATTLKNARVSIVLPQQVALAPGYSADMPLSELSPSGFAVVLWECIPSLRQTTNEVQIKIIVVADGLPPDTCTTTTIIQGFSRILTISIPKGNIVGYGGTVTVPVLISNPSLGAFNEFTCELYFDESAVQLQSSDKAGTLTEQWETVSVSRIAAGAFVLSGSGAIPISQSGTLMTLTFVGASDEGGHGTFDVLHNSILDLENATLPNGFTITLVDGDITTSGSCVVPLDASEQYVLAQNKPNPFNPVTTIGYQLPASLDAVSTTIEVYDAYGRLIRRYDEGLRQGGLHSVLFDASGLKSGVYVYRLIAGPYSKTKKMIFMK